MPLGPNGEASRRFRLGVSVTRKRFSEPSVWTTPVSSTCIRKTIFSGRPIWLFWSRWSCPPSTAWFKANRRYLEVFQLPPYWPELNATERIWNYTRKYVTHNRFFERPQDLCDALFRRFDYVRHHPQEIEALLHPFF